MYNRSTSLQRATKESFDLCIIGGGITGAGVLAEATARGYKAILIEKNDFASGTSSRSSKMVHGGLRYLKKLQFGLVREALREREHLFQKYPDLVRPLPFIMPAYNTLDLWGKALVIGLYSRMAGSSVVGHSQKLTAGDVAARLPGFRTDGLKGGVMYWDGWTNDALLTITTLRDATSQGGVILNYCSAREIVRNGTGIEALVAQDRLNDQPLTIRARAYVNATGVWTDEVLKLVADAPPSLRPSMGVHVVVSAKRFASDCAAIVSSGTSDSRYLYSFPWEHGLTVLGTTDTDYTGSKDEIACSRTDVEYILNAFNGSFPSLKLGLNDVVSVYAGLRPLLDDQHGTDSYGRSREYRIWWSADNFLNIAGGKLTSHLSMGKHCLDTLVSRLRFPSDMVPPAESAGGWPVVEDMLSENPLYAQRLFAGLTTRAADVIYYTRYFFAQKVADVLTRRLAVTYALREFDEEGVRRTALLMARELQKEPDWVEEQVAEYQAHWREFHPDFLNDSARTAPVL